MGTMLNIIILVIFWSMTIFVLGIPTSFTNVLTGQENLVSALTNQIFTVEVLTASVGVVIATAILAPSALPFVLFAPAAFVLITFLTYPQSILQSAALPTELSVFIRALYTILIIALGVSLVTWFKQGGD